MLSKCALYIRNARSRVGVIYGEIFGKHSNLPEQFTPPGSLRGWAVTVAMVMADINVARCIVGIRLQYPFIYINFVVFKDYKYSSKLEKIIGTK